MSHRKKKVAHLTSVHTPADTRITFRECATLALAGYEVVLIAPGAAGDLPRGVRLRSVAPARTRFERMTRTMWRIYRAALDERADVYHFHDPELIAVGLALRARGARVIFDVHEDIPVDIRYKNWIPAWLRPMIAAGSRIALHAVQGWYSAIVTATPAIARNFPRGRTVVVCNYPSLEELRAGESDFEKRPRAVAYLGNITALRGAAEMVAALTSAQMAPDIRLMLAGRFEDDELEQRLRALPAWRHVEFSGWCARSNVPRLLSSVRAGLLVLQPASSFEDSMPTKLYEYLGAGLPVVVSRSLNCSAIVHEFDCGLAVDPCDVDAIAQAVTFLVNHPDAAQAMGARGRRFVMERCQWNNEAKKLTQLYAEIA